MMILVTIVCYPAILLLIAHITGWKGGSNAVLSEGENRSPWYIAVFGMIDTSTLGVTPVSVLGMVKATNMAYMQTILGFFFGYLTAAHVFLPLYYRLSLISMYIYLDTRIGKRAYRIGVSLFLLSCMLGTATKLYLVCLVLYTYAFRDMGIPFWNIAAGSVASVWVYIHKSGIKAIVWTDTLQAFRLIAALICILVFVTAKPNLDFSGVIQITSNSEHSRIFVFDDWMSCQSFLKQFLSGVFIVIIMTGLGRDMVQKNLSCHSLRDAQKDMYCYGFAFAPFNLLFPGLDILLLVLAQEIQLELPTIGDNILPMFATQGYLGEGVLILFVIGIIAAAFNNSDSALITMTTSFCIDLLNTGKDTEGVARKKQSRVHVGLSILLVFFICFVDALNNQSVIDAIYVTASHIYGPLPGMFAFGLFTRQ